MSTKPESTYYMYILGNGRGALYVGVTNDLERRLYEHKRKQVDGFTRRYAIDQLLYFQEFPLAQEAIDAEKRIKGWTRKKKLGLIREMNPTFEDLSKDWLTD